MTRKKSCFIIMPITTPDELVDRYNKDPDHFEHVMDVLFVPAVEAAELKPIRPIAKGSDLIQGGIIKNLQMADMVLCDMSILNANVFFELGMRTAINQPVALVKDKETPKAPFDLSMINHHTYDNELRPWKLDDEIESLKVHLLNSLENADEGNSLWNHLSMTMKAEPLKDRPDDESQLALINRQLEDIRGRLQENQELRFFDRGVFHASSSMGDELLNDRAERVVELAHRSGIGVSIKPSGPNTLVVSGKITKSKHTHRVFEHLATETAMPVNVVFDWDD